NTAPSIPLAELLAVLASPSRWLILRELASGDKLMVAELAERVGLNPDATSKAMAVLREARVVTQGRNRLYQLAPQFIVDKTERILDFGYCQLRMNFGLDR
ncbi:MAG: ArsR family transcriptional regulator, partial [Chthoniobacterales bacterium]